MSTIPGSSCTSRSRSASTPPPATAAPSPTTTRVASGMPLAQPAHRVNQHRQTLLEDDPPDEADDRPALDAQAGAELSGRRRRKALRVHRRGHLQSAVGVPGDDPRGPCVVQGQHAVAPRAPHGDARRPGRQALDEARHPARSEPEVADVQREADVSETRAWPGAQLRPAAAPAERRRRGDRGGRRPAAARAPPRPCRCAPAPGLDVPARPRWSRRRGRPARWAVVSTVTAAPRRASSSASRWA